jgi:hypothetical protein
VTGSELPEVCAPSPVGGPDELAALISRASTARRESFWTRDDVGEDLVIHEQPETAVYLNTSGAIVVRQRAASGDEDEDVVAVIRPEFAAALIGRVAELAELRVRITPAPTSGGSR